MGECLPGGVCLGGSARGGVHLPPLWTEFLTHACENYPSATSFVDGKYIDSFVSFSQTSKTYIKKKI